jgi:hypothetical protein
VLDSLLAIKVFSSVKLHIMPRALANNKVKVKPEPYPSSSASSSPSKSVTSQSKGKRLTWTEEMDQKIMAHVLNCSNIEFVFNWEDLIKDEFPEITKKQVCRYRRPYSKTSH